MVPKILYSTMYVVKTCKFWHTNLILRKFWWYKTETSKFVWNVNIPSNIFIGCRNISNFQSDLGNFLFLFFEISEILFISINSLYMTTVFYTVFIWTILISFLIMIILTNELLLTLGHEMLCHLAPQKGLHLNTIIGWKLKQKLRKNSTNNIDWPSYLFDHL